MGCVDGGPGGFVDSRRGAGLAAAGALGSGGREVGCSKSRSKLSSSLKSSSLKKTCGAEGSVFAGLYRRSSGSSLKGSDSLYSEAMDALWRTPEETIELAGFVECCRPTKPVILDIPGLAVMVDAGFLADADVVALAWVDFLNESIMFPS